MGNPELARLRERLRNHWTHSSVLALALAKTESTRFKDDPHLWHKTIHDLKEATREEAPTLLRDIYFDMRDHEQPYSEEVDQFFSIMHRSGAIVTWGMGPYAEHEMPEKAKEAIKRNHSPKLDKYMPCIDKMAQIIEEKLAIPKPQT